MAILYRLNGIFWRTFNSLFSGVFTEEAILSRYEIFTETAILDSNSLDLTDESGNTILGGYFVFTETPLLTDGGTQIVGGVYA